MQYVENIEDFREHMESHIENVGELALLIVDKIKDNERLCDLYGIPEDMDWDKFKSDVKELIGFHDSSKMRKTPIKMEAPLMKSMYKDSSGVDVGERNLTMLEALYAMYGRKKKDFSEEEFEESTHVISFLNSQDFQITETYAFRIFEHDPIKINLYKIIENFADKIERGMNPITEEEFGRDIVKASEFAEFEHPEENALCFHVELEYKEVCSNRFLNKRIQEMDEKQKEELEVKMEDRKDFFHELNNLDILFSTDSFDEVRERGFQNQENNFERYRMSNIFRRN